jgi:hypothetical protein
MTFYLKEKNNVISAKLNKNTNRSQHARIRRDRGCMTKGIGGGLAGTFLTEILFALLAKLKGLPLWQKWLIISTQTRQTTTLITCKPYVQSAMDARQLNMMAHLEILKGRGGKFLQNGGLAI